MRGAFSPITLNRVIFEAETAGGKAFDVILILAIALSVLTVMADSMKPLSAAHGSLFHGLEWLFTILFTLEYALRLFCIDRPAKYALSFFGIVDLLAIIPTYLSLFFPGAQFLMIVRVLRVLRVFRVLKLAQYLQEATLLVQALKASQKKILIFLFGVVTLVVILGSLMYLIEGEENGFTSIPRGIYWAVVTLTTVGYGDMAPRTGWGQALATLVMIMGYSIIAVPTGIMTVEIANAFKRKISTRACRACSADGHDSDASHCKYCGEKL